MDECEKKKQELLAELARRFRESANTLKGVARRIDDAARLHQETVRRLNETDRPLRECVGCQDGVIPFTYLEFVEFSNADEFRKFRQTAVVTEDEIRAVDWNDLAKKLLAS